MPTWLVQIYLGLFLLLQIAVSLRALYKVQNPAAAAAWILLIWFLPFAGLGLYILFGERTLGRIRARRATSMFSWYRNWLEQISHDVLTPPKRQGALAGQINRMMKQVLNLPSLRGNTHQLYDEASQILEGITADIQQAQQSIILEFYICQSGGLVDELLESLALAAERGVEVRMIVDSVGSRGFLRSNLRRQLEQRGVVIVDALHANIFRLWFRRIDLRQHRKITCIDSRLAWVGSMNLVDPRFFKSTANLGQWIDAMIRLEGPAVDLLQGILVFDWEMECGERLEHLLELPNDLQDHGAAMQIVPSGPIYSEDHLHQLLLMSVYHARSSIRITTPYFVPDPVIVSALRSAAWRGVEVEIIIPRKIDSKLATWAGQSFYSELLAAGVKIYYFQGGLLHTKSVLVDQELCLFGTVNLDNRSIWLNFEISVLAEGSAFCADILALWQRYRLNCQILEASEWAQRGRVARLMEKIVRLISPVL